MKKLFYDEKVVKNLVSFNQPGGDDAEDGGGTDANPVEPDYSDPDSEA